MPLGDGSAAEVDDDVLVEFAEQLAAAGATYLARRSQADDRSDWIGRCRRLASNVLPRIARIETFDPLYGRRTA